MYIPHLVKKSPFFQELSPDKQEIFFEMVQKKIIPTIDNIYYSVFIQDDGSEETNRKMMPLLELLLEKKAIAKHEREMQPFMYELMVLPYGIKMYDVGITDPDIYDIFVNSSENNINDVTNRIQVQLRATGLWSRTVEGVLNDSYLKTEAILSKYGLKISHVQENRIDYCYHTNIRSDVHKIFDVRKKDYKCFQTSKQEGFGHWYKTKREKMDYDYYMIGKKGDEWFARFYDKSNEVIREAYKNFFFKLWQENGLISMYDRYCMEYAIEHQNPGYIEKAKLAFCVEFGADDVRKKEYEKALDSKSKTLSDYRQMADEFMPPVSSVINIEFQTMRDFYRHSDTFIDYQKIIERDCHPNLKRMYKIIDNREIFLRWLTGTGVHFADGKDADGKPKYLDWWKRIRNVDVGGIKAEEELLREYAANMDEKIVKRKLIKTVASLNVKECRPNKGYVNDYFNALKSIAPENITDNQVNEMRDMMLKNLGGKDAKELKSEYLKDYNVIRAKLEMRYKNHKRKREQKKSTGDELKQLPEQNNAAPDKVTPTPEAVEDNAGERLIKCMICSEVKPSSEFWTYGGRGSENLGKCKECRKLLTDDYSDG